MSEWLTEVPRRSFQLLVAACAICAVMWPARLSAQNDPNDPGVTRTIATARFPIHPPWCSRPVTTPTCIGKPSVWLTTKRSSVPQDRSVVEPAGVRGHWQRGR